MSLIVVSGALASKPWNGGDEWTRLSWTLGLKRLGHDVYFIEQIAPAVCVDAAGAACDLDRSVNLAFFRDVTERFGLSARASLVLEEVEGEKGSKGAALVVGPGLDELVRVAESADLLVNISGHLTFDTLKPRFRRRAFIDLDPGFTQCWHQQGLAEDRFRDHHFYFTVGYNVGTPGCDIPIGDIAWRPIRQPVVLDDWPIVVGGVGSGVASVDHRRFTTVSSWRGPFGRVTHNGVQFGLKAHEFRKVVTLPTLTSQRFEIALDVHPADQQDIDLLRSNAWALVDPACVASDPFTFRNYIQTSDAEFSVAQGIYVDTQSGWFSDRTVRYLASGKPVLVQDTGLGRTYPPGLGLVTFRTLDEAVRGAEAIGRDYETHARAARAIAEECFDSDKVLGALLQTVGVVP